MMSLKEVPDLSELDLIKIIEIFKPRIIYDEHLWYSGIVSSIEDFSKDYESRKWIKCKGYPQQYEIIIGLEPGQLRKDEKESLPNRTFFHELLHLQAKLYGFPLVYRKLEHPVEQIIEEKAIRLAKERQELINYFETALELFYYNKKRYEDFKKDGFEIFKIKEPIIKIKQLEFQFQNEIK